MWLLIGGWSEVRRAVRALLKVAMQQGQFFELVGTPQFTLAAGPAGYGNVHIPAITPGPVYAPLKPAYSFSMPPPGALLRVFLGTRRLTRVRPPQCAPCPTTQH